MFREDVCKDELGGGFIGAESPQSWNYSVLVRIGRREKTPTPKTRFSIWT